MPKGTTLAFNVISFALEVDLRVCKDIYFCPWMFKAIFTSG